MKKHIVVSYVLILSALTIITGCMIVFDPFETRDTPNYVFDFDVDMPYPAAYHRILETWPGILTEGELIPERKFAYIYTHRIYIELKPVTETKTHIEYKCLRRLEFDIVEKIYHDLNGYNGKWLTIKERYL